MNAPAAVAEPPQNLEAEEYVLGAMMLSSSAIEAVSDIIDAGDFYRESHAKIYRAAVELHGQGIGVDAVTIADKLDELGQLEEIGGKERIREIATLVPATSNAAHHALIVREMAQLRHFITVGDAVKQLGWERGADSAQLLETARELVASLRDRQSHAPLQWLTHREVLELKMEADRYLVDDLVPAGAVGTIAGVPETHKSWLAQAIAIRVARGQGYIFGRRIAAQGPVGYLWQDDSTHEEAERVKAFEDVHPSPADLPILWGLNLGIQLPRDIGRLRHDVVANRLVLLVLDSFYNFLPGVDLKDESAEQVVSLLKREISDATGCTVLIVDHMPWATEQNRQRLRAYGGVFKNAATRFGIYLDAAGDKLHIEARGNNIRGFAKRLAYWDADTLELKLLDGEHHADTLKAPAAEIRDWIREQGGEALARDVRAYFEISEDTLGRRLSALVELGVAHQGGRGKPGRLVLTPPADPSDEQIEIAAEVPARHEFPHAGTSNGAGTFPHNGADLDPAGTGSRTEHLRELETSDLQQKGVPAVAAPLRGGPAQAGAGIPGDRRPVAAKAEAWMLAEGYRAPDPTEALVASWPLLAVADIERIAQLGLARARELSA